MRGSISAWLRTADITVLRFLRTRGHAPLLQRAFIRYSKMGEHSGIWFAAAGLGLTLHSRRRRVYLRLARTLIAVEIVNALLKIVIGRQRPRLDGLPPLAWTRSQRSCPSAHASGSFAAARVLSQALPAAPIYAAAFAMAVSRPYLGVHYPSDVVAGMALGTVIADLVSRAPRASGAEP